MIKTSMQRKIAFLLLAAILSSLLLCGCSGSIGDDTVEKLLKKEGYTKYEKQFGDWVDWTYPNEHVEFRYYASKTANGIVDYVIISYYPRDRGDGFKKPEWQIRSTGSTWDELN